MKTKLIVLLLVITSGLRAQTDTNIFYNDINPDYLISSPCCCLNPDTFKIDINNDGVDDIAFYLVQISYRMQVVESLHSNTNYAFFTPERDDSLTTSFFWRTTSYPWNSIDYDSSRIAIRVVDGSDYYYGWIRVLFNGSNDLCINERTITIKEYAFCKIGNYPFLFGQTDLGLSVNELLNENNTQVYFNGSTANIIIQSDKQLKEIKLVNMLGATVKSFTNINALNSNISTNNLAHGNYIVQVKYKDNSVYAVQVAF